MVVAVKVIAKFTKLPKIGGNGNPERCLGKLDRTEKLVGRKKISGTRVQVISGTRVQVLNKKIHSG